MIRYSPEDLYLKQNRVERFFFRHVSNREDREDLAQEALYISVKNIDTLLNPDSIDSWLYGICRNVLKRYYSEKSRQKRLVLEEIAVQDRSEDSIAVDLVLTELPEQLRLLYKLYYEERYKIAEISRILDRPDGTVKYQLHDLREKVRRKLAGMGKGRIRPGARSLSIRSYYRQHDV